MFTVSLLLIVCVLLFSEVVSFKWSTTRTSLTTGRKQQMSSNLPVKSWTVQKTELKMFESMLLSAAEVRTPSFHLHTLFSYLYLLSHQYYIHL